MQRDIGDGSDHGDDRNNRRNPLALAVTRADEISDGGDILGFGKPGNPADQGGAKPDQQDGADINGKKIISRDGGKADGSEKRP